MHVFDQSTLKKLYIPAVDSHKGQNGKLLLIGGSHLFHAASLWALTIASRIVDMVFYASVPENNRIVEHAKNEFRNGIVIKRESIDDYAKEADCILIGPGMVRAESGISNFKFQMSNVKDINTIENEGEQTYWITKYMLEKYPHKKFVLDAGALQMMEPEWLDGLQEKPILTPHPREFETLFGQKHQQNQRNQQNQIVDTSEKSDISDFSAIRHTDVGRYTDVSEMAQKYNCVILLKGQEDVVCSPEQCIAISGGNAGMTKGGTGDVLAGLVAALYCNNDVFLSAAAGSYFNKKAGESLYQKMGLYFNSSDLAMEIPAVMAKALNQT